MPRCLAALLGVILLAPAWAAGDAPATPEPPRPFQIRVSVRRPAPPSPPAPFVIQVSAARPNLPAPPEPFVIQVSATRPEPPAPPEPFAIQVTALRPEPPAPPEPFAIQVAASRPEPPPPPEPFAIQVTAARPEPPAPPLPFVIQVSALRPKPPPPPTPFAITVSARRPEREVRVPDLYGKSQSQAEALLAQEELALGIVSQKSLEAFKSEHPTQGLGAGLSAKVRSQRPSSGETVEAGSAVDFELYPAFTRVPDLTSLRQGEAETSLGYADLVLGIVTQPDLETFRAEVGPSGLDPGLSSRVRSHSPAAEALVAPKSTVDLNLYPPMVRVPNLYGKLEAEAQAVLTAAGLALGQVTIADPASSPVPLAGRPGTVSQQSPTPESIVSPGAAVNLEVIATRTRVPNLYGKREAQARSLIARAELGVGEVRVVDPSAQSAPIAATAGTVIEQSPPPEASVKPHTTVHFAILGEPAVEHEASKSRKKNKEREKKLYELGRKVGETVGRAILEGASHGSGGSSGGGSPSGGRTGPETGDQPGADPEGAFTLAGTWTGTWNQTDSNGTCTAAATMVLSADHRGSFRATLTREIARTPDDKGHCLKSVSWTVAARVSGRRVALEIQTGFGSLPLDFRILGPNTISTNTPTGDGSLVCRLQRN